MSEQGYANPEAAVVAGMDVPPQYFTIVGSRVHGDTATVWLLTNDREPFEEYECYCVREDGVWHETHGSGGFSVLTPPGILLRANEIRSKAQHERRA